MSLASRPCDNVGVDTEYKNAFAALNAEQKRAVEAIQGPVLVLAGPGTGKTQLLATRVGYILQNTDALPQNILCLTFTEAGVSAMRDRLTKFLGPAAYDVQLNTYHAFGSELLRRYPQYSGSYDFQPIDELGADSLVREILDSASYSNPLKSASTYARDLREFMSECKRALLEPEDLVAVTRSNQEFINRASKDTATILKNFVRIDKNSPGLFEQIYKKLRSTPAKTLASVNTIKSLCLKELAEALEQSAETGKTKPLTAWKNNWLAKDENAQFILAGGWQNQKIAAASEIYSLYKELLAKRKLYDYDDMILQAIKALKLHPDFKFTLAEQYQYILLDEFQDTNPAQFKIVELLADNPVNEGRPNILAVGDDDQAIYAFQGADHANMQTFSKLYRGVEVISLRDNYRSQAEILDVAYNVSGQIKDRLHEQFQGITKILKAASGGAAGTAIITHNEFVSDAAQYAWVAGEIKRLSTKERIPLNDIAVLAPRHRYLIPLLPFLSAQELSVRYEKRENVLDKPIVRQLEQMSRLVLALSGAGQPLADSLWPEVLSYDFWGLATELIWQISWDANLSKNGWTSTLLADAKTAPIASYFLRLKDLLAVTNLEQQLDLLVGVLESDPVDYKLPIRSPFFNYYFHGSKPKDALYLESLSDLAVLRGRLRAWRKNEVKPFSLRDFLSFIDAHRASEISILNTSPYVEAKAAVNVMTAYQAKGREFKAVFIVAASDEVWGSASRVASSNINLPANLSFIRYRGTSDDERLRLLYVALTRAKTHLYLTSYASTLDGKATRPLKYLAGQSSLAPIAAKTTDTHVTSADLQNYWHLRHLPPLESNLAALLEPTLSRYQLSPTNLNQFTDVTRGGPEAFFLNTILRFPKGQAPAASFGTAIHQTLGWAHEDNLRRARPPSVDQVLTVFDERLALQRLAANDYELLVERGRASLVAFLASPAGKFNKSDLFETNFKSQGVFVGPAHLSGRIDKLVVDKQNKLITVMDFKTGKSYDRWRGDDLKLHKYKQQLLMYKILVEGSHQFAGYKVNSGILEFVEPSRSGKIDRLELALIQADIDDLKKLITAVWQCIQTLDFPDVSGYPATITGVKVFETDLKKIDARK